MNKVELASKVAEKTNLTKGDSEKALKAFIETIIETLQAGEQVDIAKFAKFEPKEMPARIARDPRTGESLNIPNRQKLKITPYSALKNSVKY
ncbi:HU family DNA-binding protein [Paenibacillus sp. NPDC058174]|uniref:HU family DNA-binding protein n=1 Tax=Paenibacillus sp. NPDC058174 TaxID=3346366 RepID=UPI0036DA1A75